MALRHGVIQRRWLTDSFNRFHDYLRISVTERCNLRCQYCMPKNGIDLTPKEELMNTDEMLRLAKIFTNMGVKKIRLTGGEPLIRPDFEFIAIQLGKLREIGLEKLCITTNGINLSRKLPILKDSHITNINISLDTLIDYKFEIITRRPGHKRVLQAIHDSIDCGMHTKINCVVMRGVNDEEVANFAEMAAKFPIEVRFIEYMPFGGNEWSEDLLVPWMETFDSIEKGLSCQLSPLPGKVGDVSKKFSAPGWAGSVGFITTMTTQFCGTCNRLRLLADGQLKVCLFDSNDRSLTQV